MISDVLSDAVFSIHDYLKAEPECYRSRLDEIENLVQHMNSVRQHLDTPPLSAKNRARLQAKVKEVFGT